MASEERLTTLSKETSPRSLLRTMAFARAHSERTSAFKSMFPSGAEPLQNGNRAPKKLGMQTAKWATQLAADRLRFAPSSRWQGIADWIAALLRRYLSRFWNPFSGAYSLAHRQRRRAGAEAENEAEAEHKAEAKNETGGLFTAAGFGADRRMRTPLRVIEVEHTAYRDRLLFIRPDITNHPGKSRMPGEADRLGVIVRASAANRLDIIGRVGKADTLGVIGRLSVIDKWGEADRLSVIKHALASGMMGRGVTSERSPAPLNMPLSYPAMPLVSWLGVAAPRPEPAAPRVLPSRAATPFFSPSVPDTAFAMPARRQSAEAFEQARAPFPQRPLIPPMPPRAPQPNPSGVSASFAARSEPTPDAPEPLPPAARFANLRIARVEKPILPTPEPLPLAARFARRHASRINPDVIVGRWEGNFVVVNLRRRGVLKDVSLQAGDVSLQAGRAQPDTSSRPDRPPDSGITRRLSFPIPRAAVPAQKGKPLTPPAQPEALSAERPGRAGIDVPQTFPLLRETLISRFAAAKTALSVYKSISSRIEAEVRHVLPLLPLPPLPSVREVKDLRNLSRLTFTGRSFPRVQNVSVPTMSVPNVSVPEVMRAAPSALRARYAVENRELAARSRSGRSGRFDAAEDVGNAGEDARNVGARDSGAENARPSAIRSGVLLNAIRSVGLRLFTPTIQSAIPETLRENAIGRFNLRLFTPVSRPTRLQQLLAGSSIPPQVLEQTLRGGSWTKSQILARLAVPPQPMWQSPRPQQREGAAPRHADPEPTTQTARLTAFAAKFLTRVPQAAPHHQPTQPAHYETETPGLFSLAGRPAAVQAKRQKISAKNSDSISRALPQDILHRALANTLAHLGINTPTVPRPQDDWPQAIKPAFYKPGLRADLRPSVLVLTHAAQTANTTPAVRPIQTAGTLRNADATLSDNAFALRPPASQTTDRPRNTDLIRAADAVRTGNMALWTRMTAFVHRLTQPHSQPSIALSSMERSAAPMARGMRAATLPLLTLAPMTLSAFVPLAAASPLPPPVVSTASFAPVKEPDTFHLPSFRSFRSFHAYPSVQTAAFRAQSVPGVYDSGFASGMAARAERQSPLARIVTPALPAYRGLNRAAVSASAGLSAQRQLFPRLSKTDAAPAVRQGRAQGHIVGVLLAESSSIQGAANIKQGAVKQGAASSAPTSATYLEGLPARLGVNTPTVLRPQDDWPQAIKPAFYKPGLRADLRPSVLSSRSLKVRSFSRFRIYEPSTIGRLVHGYVNTPVISSFAGQLAAGYANRPKIEIGSSRLARRTPAAPALQTPFAPIEEPGIFSTILRAAWRVVARIEAIADAEEAQAAVEEAFVSRMLQSDRFAPVRRLADRQTERQTEARQTDFAFPLEASPTLPLWNRAPIRGYTSLSDNVPFANDAPFTEDTRFADDAPFAMPRANTIQPSFWPVIFQKQANAVFSAYKGQESEDYKENYKEEGYKDEGYKDEDYKTAGRPAEDAFRPAYSPQDRFQPNVRSFAAPLADRLEAAAAMQTSQLVALLTPTFAPAPPSVFAATQTVTAPLALASPHSLQPFTPQSGKQAELPASGFRLPASFLQQQTPPTPAFHQSAVAVNRGVDKISRLRPTPAPRQAPAPMQEWPRATRAWPLSIPISTPTSTPLLSPFSGRAEGEAIAPNAETALPTTRRRVAPVFGTPRAFTRAAPILPLLPDDRPLTPAPMRFARTEQYERSAPQASRMLALASASGAESFDAPAVTRPAWTRLPAVTPPPNVSLPPDLSLPPDVSPPPIASRNADAPRLRPEEAFRLPDARTEMQAPPDIIQRQTVTARQTIAARATLMPRQTTLRLPNATPRPGSAAPVAAVSAARALSVSSVLAARAPQQTLPVAPRRQPTADLSDPMRVQRSDTDASAATPSNNKPPDTPHADAKNEEPNTAAEINLLAHEVWSVLKRRLANEAERMGRR